MLKALEAWPSRGWERDRSRRSPPLGGAGIPPVATARRFAAGHRLRLSLTSNDNLPNSEPMLGFYNTPVGPAATNTVHAKSRLLLSVVPSADVEQSE